VACTDGVAGVCYDGDVAAHDDRLAEVRYDEDVTVLYDAAVVAYNNGVNGVGDHAETQVEKIAILMIEWRSGMLR
jgi:hypothetical protein